MPVTGNGGFGHRKKEMGQRVSDFSEAFGVWSSLQAETTEHKKELASGEVSLSLFVPFIVIVMFRFES